MKRLLLINSVCGTGSTGRIVSGIAREYEADGWQVRIAYGRGEAPERDRAHAVRIGTDFDVRLHGLYTRLFDRHGFGSGRATARFLAWAEDYNPDLLWLHNIHGYYIHVGKLFQWIKTRPGMEVRWTLHDCWAFTGHCAYFDYIGCEKWQNGCHHCPDRKDYPRRWLIDCSKSNYEKKRALFTGVPGMTIITPSEWLAGLVGQSFLREYPVRVVHNTIDKEVFQPTDSSLREQFHLENKTVILGAAAFWERRKGLNDFIALSRRLDDSCRIVLIGVDERTRRQLPSSIIAVARTENRRELAAFYTMADVYVNPTYEDNYPTTNLEAIACGTPVVTYDTGGSGESARGHGSVVRKGDLDALEAEIKRWTARGNS